MVRRKRASSKIEVHRGVKGYHNPRSGKWVKSYKRRIKVFPDHYFTWIIYKGQKRLAEVWITRDRNGHIIKRDYRFVEDLRLERTIEQSRKVKQYMEAYGDNRTMTKEFPDHLAKALKQLADNPNEYSIAIDFERAMQQPQRVAIVKGTEVETITILDFEMFGHTHPNQKHPRPSVSDLQHMQYLRPEFIITPNGEMIFLNIEDPDKYRQWVNKTSDRPTNSIVINKEDFNALKRRKKFQKISPYLTIYNYHETEQGKEMFFEETGVRIYPYKKITKIELKDDPFLEKKMPTVHPYYMRKWQSKSESKSKIKSK